jgi:hypothetical protein
VTFGASAVPVQGGDDVRPRVAGHGRITHAFWSPVASAIVCTGQPLPKRHR